MAHENRGRSSADEGSDGREESVACIRSIFAVLLGVATVQEQDNFFELGGDSILALRAISRMRDAGLRIDAETFFASPIPSLLAERARSDANGVGEQGLLVGEFPLAPIQCWFFERRFAVPEHFNQVVLLSAPRISFPKFRQAVAMVLAQHDALRLRFPVRSGRRVQRYGLVDVDEVVRCSVEVGSGEVWERAVEARIKEAQRGFVIERGPLVRFWVVQTEGSNAVIILSAHHLCVDAVSLRITVEDLARCYSALDAGSDFKFASKGTSYRQWIQILEKLDEAQLAREIAMSQNVARLPFVSINLPHAEGADGTEVFGTAETKFISSRMGGVAAAGVQDWIITAFARVLTELSNTESLAIDIESHGRTAFGERADLSNTVGWFTSIFPVVLTCKRGEGARAAVERTVGALRMIPHCGAGFGLLRYGRARGDVSTQGARPAVLFNYLGETRSAVDGSDWSFLPLRTPCAVDERNRLPYDIVIECFVHESLLHSSVASPSGRFRGPMLDALNAAARHCLRAMVHECHDATALPFSDSGLTFDEICAVAAQLRD